MTIGEKIRKGRKQLYMKREELARRIGKGVSTVQKYEMGIIEPPISVLKKISDALGVDLMWLCGKKEKPLEEPRTIHENMQSEREKLGLSKADVARICGMPYSTYDGYEKGYRTPDIDVLRLIADALGISIHNLINDHQEGQTQDVIIQLDTDTDSDLIEHLEKIRNVNGYLKALLRADIAVSKERG